MVRAIEHGQRAKDVRRTRPGSLIESIYATVLVERPSTGRTAGLAIVAVLAALAHSFGGFYAIATIGAARAESLPGEPKKSASPNEYTFSVGSKWTKAWALDACAKPAAMTTTATTTRNDRRITAPPQPR